MREKGKKLCVCGAAVVFAFQNSFSHSLLTAIIRNSNNKQEAQRRAVAAGFLCRLSCLFVVCMREKVTHEIYQ